MMARFAFRMMYIPSFEITSHAITIALTEDSFPETAVQSPFFLPEKTTKRDSIILKNIADNKKTGRLQFKTADNPPFLSLL